MRLNPLIPADQNLEKNCLEKKKNKEREKKSVGTEEKRIEKKELLRPQVMGSIPNY